MTHATENTNPANITLSQLGGSGRLRAMIGAKDFMSENDGRTLIFKFKGCRKSNCLRITLNALDLYDIEFLKIRRLECETIAEFEGIGCENLKGSIEEFTGLYLSF
jgi:hypothetical protein